MLEFGFPSIQAKGQLEFRWPSKLPSTWRQRQEDSWALLVGHSMTELVTDPMTKNILEAREMTQLVKVLVTQA